MAINKLDTGAIQDNAITNAKMADDAVGVADLAATGTPSSTTFLRGDNAWVTPTDTDTNTTYSVQDGELSQNNFTNDDHTKLNNIEASADVTDATNVAAAGALMDSELAGIAAVKATTGTFLTADQTKLDGIATSANNYVHPNHSGDVVSAADGAMTIQTDAVDIAMLSATGTAGSTTFLRGDNAWATAGSTSASDLTSGTLPDARFPSTLPAISGANLTGIATDFSSLTDTTVATTDPAYTTNPSAVGHIWFNKTTGNIFTCTRNTTDENVWINSGQDNHYRYKATDYGTDVFNDSSCIFHMSMNGNDYAYGAAFDTYLNNSDGVSWTNNSMFGSKAARFTGAGEITVPFMSGVFTRSSNFSISMWIIEKGNLADGYLPYSFNGNSSTNGRGSAVRGNGISRVSTTAPNTMSGALSSSFTVNDGDHFVVVGHSDATNRLYKNGSLVGTTPAATAGHSNVSNSAGGSIGGIGNVYNPTGVDGHTWYTCVVDDFRVFNRVVSASEAATLYAKGY